jgi:hypothetical protein
MASSPPASPNAVSSLGEKVAVWFQRHSTAVLWVGLAGVFSANAVVNTAVIQLEHARLGRDTAPWQVATWEWSSAVIFILLLPGVAWMERRIPLAWGDVGRRLGAHTLASLLFSLAHVGGMVLLREIVYAVNGSDYSFGNWPRELLYEYLKDGRVYLVLLLAFHFAGVWSRRSRGEAHLLVPREDVPARDSAPMPASAPFLVRKLGREFLVPASEIEHAVAAGNYVNLHVRGKEYPLRTTISLLEQQLDPAIFMRVHRGVIVNVGCIERIESLEAGEARLHLKTSQIIPCSRRYRKALKERFRKSVAP